jgi:hypothetical protein
MSTRPSETISGAAWVGNFQTEDRRPAELLLNSLRILTDATFRATLTDRLADLVGRLPRPIALYPIRELTENGDPAHALQQVDAQRNYFLPLGHPYAALPGSEALVGNVIRDVVGSRNRADEMVASSPQSIEELRRIKVRTLILVDDYSGTGKRAINYINSWVESPTIRSWFSYKLVKFHVVVHAVSLSALRVLESSPWVEQVHFFEHAPEFATVRWSKDESEAIRDFCEKHAWSKSLALGYKRSRGLWVMQHTVPNNLPMVLWQDRHKSIRDWHPFFGDRKMTPKLQQELGDYRLETRAEEIAKFLRQPRLSSALSDQPGATTRLLMLVLAASARGVRDVRRLSLLLSTPVASAEAAREACCQLGLLDSGARLTPEGRKELVAARRRAPLAVERQLLIRRDDPYYPWQLRGAGDV